jgi:hypothetical protein
MLAGGHAAVQADEDVVALPRFVREQHIEIIEAGLAELSGKRHGVAEPHRLSPLCQWQRLTPRCRR